MMGNKRMVFTNINTAELCSHGRLALADIIKETHLPTECESVYNRLAFDKDFPVGIQFDWRKEW